MPASPDDVVRSLTARGFHPIYRSTAVRILVHPDLPGVEVRLGTVYAVVDRDGREVYRAPLTRFDPDAALRRVARPDVSEPPG